MHFIYLSCSKYVDTSGALEKTPKSSRKQAIGRIYLRGLFRKAMGNDNTASWNGIAEDSGR
jgi:hypothetical protein